MPAIENLDFLNLNSLRNYPIKDELSRISVDGSFTIPNNFIVDAQIAATYDPTRRFYVSKISNLVSTIIVEITDSLSTVAGTFTINVGVHTQYTEYYLTPSANYVGATGLIVVDSVAIMGTLPAGLFSFTLTNTEFETRTVIPALQGINRLIFANADGTSVTLTGDVNVVARSNLRFKLLDGYNTVILDAGNGLGLNIDCNPDGPCIQTVNGIPPDNSGNFTLDFADCANLAPIPAGTGLILSDSCCKPCMGCNDIGELTTRLTQVESALLQLRDYYNSLETLFDNYKTTVSYDCSC